MQNLSGFSSNRGSATLPLEAVISAILCFDHRVAALCKTSNCVWRLVRCTTKAEKSLLRHRFK